MDKTPSDVAVVKHVTPTFAQMHATAVFDKRLSNAQFRILTVLSLYANSDDICWPKLDTLADLLGTHKSAISRTINQLVDLGYVTIEKRGFPARNLYRVRRKAVSSSVDATATLDAIFDTRVDATATKSLHHGNSRVDATATDRTDHIEQTIQNTVSNVHALPSSLARSAENGRADRAQQREIEREAMKRDPLYGAFVRSLDFEPETRQMWDEWRVGINELNRLHATPQDVYRAVSAYYSRFPQATCSVRAIVKWWPALKEGKSHDVAKLEASQRSSETVRAETRAEDERRRAEARAAREQLERDIASGLL